MQRVNGIYSVLSNAAVYEALMTILGAKRKREILVRDYIRPFPGMRILDCGCGPAEVVGYLSDVDYMGIDLSPAYIERARAKYADKARFEVQSADDMAVSGRRFDLVMALGLVHHLDDAQAIKLFQSARAMLVQGGRLLTFDGVFVQNQSHLARYILKRDRGRNVRWDHEYIALAEAVFGKENVTAHVRSDMTNIPYTHIILESTAR